MKKKIVMIIFVLLLSINVFAQENGTGDTVPVEEDVPEVILTDSPEDEAVIIPLEPVEEVPDETGEEPQVEESQLDEALIDIEPADVDVEPVDIVEDTPEIVLIDIPEEIPDQPPEEDDSEVEPTLISEPSKNEDVLPASSNIFTKTKIGLASAVSVISGKVKWVLSRDYISAAKNSVYYVLGLSLWVKLVLVFIALVAALFVWAFYFRDTKSNNLRKARRLHRLGEQAHLENDEEQAELYYKKAAEYRELAQEQW